MDLCFLIPSKMRRLVLGYFCQNPDSKIYVNALARELKSAPQLVYRELVNLENWGILFSCSQGNQRLFAINVRFVCLPAIKELFRVVSEVNNTELTENQAFDWEELSKRLDRVKIDDDLIQQLRTKRTKPRSYVEEKMLKRKGLL